MRIFSREAYNFCHFRRKNPAICPDARQRDPSRSEISGKFAPDLAREVVRRPAVRASSCSPSRGPVGRRSVTPTRAPFGQDVFRGAWPVKIFSSCIVLRPSRSRRARVPHFATSSCSLI
jgi:hypothetical protein